MPWPLIIILIICLVILINAMLDPEVRNAILRGPKLETPKPPPFPTLRKYNSHVTAYQRNLQVIGQEGLYNAILRNTRTGNYASNLTSKVITQRFCYPQLNGQDK